MLVLESGSEETKETYHVPVSVPHVYMHHLIFTTALVRFYMHLLQNSRIVDFILATRLCGQGYSYFKVLRILGLKEVT